MSEKHYETATLAGGCFWCMEAVFREIEGVVKVESGYTGGAEPNPTYEEVCSDRTGHAEAIRVTFDTSIITYKEILEIFFSIHDPTQVDRQGNDVGKQYRSAIFYHDTAQLLTAEEVIRSLDEQHIWKNKIVTQVVLSKDFYPAEEYHREYFSKHPEQAYCRVVIEPKVMKFRQRWAGKLKKQDC
jgi:peptide-methionine (S)-S-oxide reductase